MVKNTMQLPEMTLLLMAAVFISPGARASSDRRSTSQDAVPEVRGGEILDPTLPAPARSPAVLPTIGAWLGLDGSVRRASGPLDVTPGVIERALVRRTSLPNEGAIEVVGERRLSWQAVLGDTDGWIDAHEAVAVAEITSAEEGVWMVALEGAEALLMADQVIAGRTTPGGWEGVPLALPKGVSTVGVVGAGERFRLTIEAPRSEVVAPAWARRSSDLSNNSAHWFAEVTLHIFDVSGKGIESLHVHYGHAVPEPAPGSLGVGEWACGYSVPTCCAQPVSLMVWPTDQETLTQAALLPVIALGRGEGNAFREAIRIPTTEHPEPPHAVFSSKTIDLVYGTEGPEEETQELLARARFDQQRLLLAGATSVQVVADVDACEAWVLSADPAHATTVSERVYLYGNTQSNRAISLFWPVETQVTARHNFISVGGQSLEGDDLFVLATKAVQLTPSQSARLTVQMDTGPDGRDLGLSVGLDGADLVHPACIVYSAGRILRGEDPRLDMPVGGNRSRDPTWKISG